MSAPTWRAIPGWEGLYEAHEDGRVRSVPRKRCKGAEIKGAFSDRGYPVLNLSRNGRASTFKRHRLIAATFHGPCPDGLEVRHLDGVKTNCAASNLAYGTRSENERDKVAHGTQYNLRKTHCIHGHEFTPDNLVPRSNGKRQCRACERNRRARARAQRNPASQQVAA